jgi:hypothetical protein
MSILAKLIVPSKTVWAEYPGLKGFEVQIAYLTRDELMKLRSKCLNNKVNRKTRAIEEEVDSDLFQTLYIQAVIKDWRGLKYKYLPKLVPTDISSVKEDDELPFGQEEAELLMKNSSDFDSWISNMLEDVQNFTKSS